MLNEGDIEFMRISQDEIYTLRQRPITVIYVEKEYDDFTGEVISEKDVPRKTSAVITDMSNRSVNGERYVVSGIEYEAGDAKFDVKKDGIDDIIDKVTRVKYDGKTYEILGDDKKGIGVRNRYEIIGRVLT